MFKIYSLNQFCNDGREQGWVLQMVTSQIRNPRLFAFNRPVSKRSKAALEKDNLGDMCQSICREAGRQGELLQPQGPRSEKRRGKEIIS